MDTRIAVKAAWVLGIVGVVLGLVLTVLNASGWSWGGVALLGIVVTSEVAFLTVGALILSRQPENRIGGLLLIEGLAFTAAVSCIVWAEHALIVSPGSLPFGAAAAWLSRLLTPLALGMFIPIFLLFPDGRPPSPRWRVVWWTWLVAVLVAMLGWVTGLHDVEVIGFFEGRTKVPNPTFVGAWAETATGIAGFVLFGCALATGVGVVMRYRRVRGLERQQIRWLAFVAVSTLGILFGTILVSTVTGSDLDGPAGEAVFLLFAATLLVGLPLTIGIAILRYHLYDLDLVIRKTLVVGALAVFITVVYVGIVVGIGSLVDASLGLRILATAVVAIAFQPARNRANHLANRLVYGKRATPYETLARFSDRVGGTYASDDVLPRVAHVIADGTAARAEVWLRIGGSFRRAASWPTREDMGAEEVDDVEQIAGDHVAPVIQLGKTLGAIAVTKDRSEPLTPNDADLVDRLAEQAGLVLANARLTADLEARLDDIDRQAAELRASRQRIVAAQDEERRRLERNIHDGAQQHLVALAVKLRLTKTMLERDPVKGHTMLGELRHQVDSAIDTIRSLSLGVYPPLLEEQGVAAALAGQYTTSGIPVRMQSDAFDRHPIEIEAAVYFCVLEALQNAAKYADASEIQVTLRDRDDLVEFEVTDDGRGFDASANGSGTGIAGMRDRLAVFGGTIDLRSTPGKGTIVLGQVPVTQEVSA